jgi:hypothetical protein
MISGPSNVVETHVAPLVRALVGETQGATAALAAEIHQVDYTSSTGRCVGLWSRIHHHPCCLVARCHTRPVEELASLGPAQRVGLHPDQQLPPAGFPDRLAYESYLPSPQKPRNEHLGRYGVTRHTRRLSEMPALDP